MAEQDATKDFFISYNQTDRSWAEWVAWHLEEAGYTTVLQAWDFRPGSNFVLKMNEATKGTKRTIVILSPAYLNALYTQSEWAAAFVQDPTGKQGTLLPVRIEECKLSGLLAALVYIDLVGLDETTARDRLLEGIPQSRAKPSVPPGFPGGGTSSKASLPPIFPGTQTVRATNFNQQDQQLGTQYNAGGDIIINPPLPKEPQPHLSQQERQDRKRMIEKVRNIWIKEVFTPSLYSTTGIALALVEQPELLGGSQRRRRREPTRGTRSQLEGKSITQVFDEASGELLIIGEAGSGKTTLLLELARDLLDRAEQDEAQQIPVVFNLSSWTTRWQPITTWLIEELERTYHVPPELRRVWVNDNWILPLFDGLDEVASEDRQKCVDCLNMYFRDHGLYQVVVCCRMTEYLSQAGRLDLQRTVVVRPLTEEQIDDYLLRIGESQQPLREALKQDASLRELASMPLMLSMLIQTYRDMPIDKILRAASSTEQQQQVFDMYIEQMLQHRDTRTHYSSSQIKRGLTWLAKQMIEHKLAAFYLEGMQPDWYLRGWLLRLYNGLVRLSIGAVCALIFLLPGGLAGGLWFSTDFSLPFGIIFGLLFGLIFALTSLVRTAITPVEVVRWSWADMWQQFVKQELRYALIRILPGGLICMLVGASLLYLFSRGKIAYAPTSPQANILIFGAVCGLLGILLSGLYNAVADELSRSMSDTDTPLTSPQSIWHTLYHSLSLTLPFVLLAALVFGLTFGSVIGPLSGLYIGLLFGLVGVALFGLTSRVKVSLKLMDVVRWGWAYIRQRDVRAELRSMVGVGIGISLMARIIKLGGPVSSLYIGLLAVVAIWLLMGIIRGLSRGVLNRQTMDKRTVVKPNQGIWNSARNSILVGLIFGTLGGSLFGLVFALASVLQGSLIDALPTLLSFGLVGGVLSGMIVGLLNGGVASIQHAVLRFFLCILRKTPWNYVRFLNHAADRILLRKVGGGYIFVHGLLMKYFAELNKEDLRSQP